MRIILKYTGAEDETLLHLLEENENVEIVGLTNKKQEFIGSEINGLPVYSIFEVVNLLTERKADKIILSSVLKIQLLKTMVEELINLGIQEDAILIAKPEFIKEPMIKNLCKWKDYTCIPYIEYHVADHCNLNCKGCVHFSPLVSQEEFADFAVVEKDLKRLHQIVEYIDEIHILGGEPLLNKELDKYLVLTRKCYPYSKIKVCTNGLLIKEMNYKLIEAFIENDVEILISLYKPIFKKIDEILKYLKSIGVKASYTEPVLQFAYTFDECGGHAAGVKRIYCSCPNLYKGYLAVCPPIAYMKYFNQRFGTHLDDRDGLINIYERDMTFRKLEEELHTVRKACDQCLFVSKEDAISMEWDQGIKQNKEDYVWIK